MALRGVEGRPTGGGMEVGNGNGRLDGTARMGDGTGGTDAVGGGVGDVGTQMQAELKRIEGAMKTKEACEALANFVKSVSNGTSLSPL